MASSPGPGLLRNLRGILFAPFLGFFCATAVLGQAAPGAALPAAAPEKPAPQPGVAPGTGPQPESAQPADPEAPVKKKQPETLLEFWVAGGYLMVPITLSSIVWVAYLVERLLALARKKTVPQDLLRGVREAVAARPLDRDGLRQRLAGVQCTLSSVVRAALERLDQPRDEIEKHVNNVAQREIYLLRRNLRVFSIVANVAPLLGLLGTVTGLVQAFREVAISGLGSGAALAPGIYEALITTVGGLVVAIPAMLTYYWLTARVDHYIHEIDEVVVDLVEAHHFPQAAR